MFLWLGWAMKSDFGSGPTLPFASQALRLSGSKGLGGMREAKTINYADMQAHKHASTQA